MKRHYTWDEHTDNELAEMVKKSQLTMVQALGLARQQGGFAMRDEQRAELEREKQRLLQEIAKKPLRREGRRSLLSRVRRLFR